MENIFLKILNMSITAGWLVLAVLLMRLLLKKAPRYLSVIMWALVGLRLVLPFSFESALSLIPSAETVPPEILYEKVPELHTGIGVVNSTVNPVISESFAPAPGASVNPLQVITLLAGWVWVIGMIAMVVYSLVSYLRIRHKTREAALLRENIWVCDNIDTPFILGIFRPRIFLPSSMAASDIPYVVAHEQAHLKRKDHLWKPLGFLLLTIHWFNPLLWVAYILLCRDIETACDEKVLKTMGEEVKAPYSHALINCSVPRRAVAACPLAFGEKNVKNRIKNILSYKKPAFWLLIAAVVVCIVLSVCFLTNPTTVNAKMQVFLDCQIAEHHQSDHSVGNACVLDYEVLGVKKNGKQTTVYMWVLYEEYSMENGKLAQESGAHTPTVVTAEKADGNYRLVEYWTPRDGSYYEDDIRAEFPWYLWGKALDSQRYIDRQQKACRELAEDYFEENPSSGSADWDRETWDRLRQMYPQYLELGQKDSLTVYVWQMSAGSYSWGLMPVGEEYTWDDPEKLMPFSLDELHTIVDAYGLEHEQVTICPIQVIYSSYLYNINDAYINNVTTLFWSWKTEDMVVDNFHEIDSAVFDVDGDGREETCALYYGPTSGIFTFTFSIFEGDILEYRNTFTANHGELRFVQQDDGTMVLSHQRNYTEDGPDIYHIVVADGNITLLDESYTTVVAYWGPQGVRTAPDEYVNYYYVADPVAAGYTVSYAGGSSSNLNGILQEALNKDTFSMSSEIHLPVLKFDTLEELEQFEQKYATISHSSAGWEEVPSFLSVFNRYNEEFFEDLTLVLVYVPCGNCTHRFDVHRLYRSDSSFYIHVQETTGADVVADAEACWFIAVEVYDTMAESITSYDAVLVTP